METVKPVYVTGSEDEGVSKYLAYNTLINYSFYSML